MQFLTNSEIQSTIPPILTVGYNGQNRTEMVKQGSKQHLVVLDHLQTYLSVSGSALSLAIIKRALKSVYRAIGYFLRAYSFVLLSFGRFLKSL